MQDNSLLLAETNQFRSTEYQSSASEWIEDDGLLRDEGVVFGLSGVMRLPDSKTESIKAYFRAKVERTEAIRQSLLNELATLESNADKQRDLHLAFKRELVSSTPGHRDLSDVSEYISHTALAPDPIAPGESSGFDIFSKRLTPVADDFDYEPLETGNLLRYLTGCVLALSICIFTYFVVREVVGVRFDYPEYIALGVMIAGMFVVFAPTSLLFSKDEFHQESPWATELWKVRLAEFGPPIAAACFAVAWGDSRGPLRFTTALLFLSIVFLLGGRLLLSLVTRLGAEIGQYKRRRACLHRKKMLRHELNKLHADGNALHQRVAEICAQLRRLRTAEDLNAECERKISLLQSEFELARAALESRMRHGYNPNRAYRE